jgi:hypothetical protein
LSKYFWNKVDKSGPLILDTACWVWTGGKTSNTKEGYGQTSTKGRNELAHRKSWELHFGVIPAGLCVCHKCDNRICVNPDHLFLGTNKDNMEDCVAKGRFVVNSKVGVDCSSAKLTEEQVLEIRKLYATGQYGYRGLAEQFGVDFGLIGRIIRREFWTHI